MSGQIILALFIGLIFIVIIVVFSIRLLYKDYEEAQLTKTGIYDIDSMSGPEFEDRLMVLYRNLGYEVEHIGNTGDIGVDLIVEKDGKRIAIQAKRYNNNVGERAVQEVHTGKHFYNCNEAIIVTNSNFTKTALKVAHKTNIKLWNRDYLVNVLRSEQDHLAESSNYSKQILSFSAFVKSLFPNKQEVKNEDIEEQQNTNVLQKDPSKSENYRELFIYISKHLSLGEKWTDLKVKLTQVGWKDDILNDVFFQIYNPRTTEEAPITIETTNN